MQIIALVIGIVIGFWIHGMVGAPAEVPSFPEPTKVIEKAPEVQKSTGQKIDQIISIITE